MSDNSKQTCALDNIGANYFNDATKQKWVGADTYLAFKESIKTGKELSKEHAKAFAAGIFAWARSRGAINFSHLFYPVRDMKTGTKTDAFIDLDFSSKKPLKDIIVDFDASKLFQSETDGSSFPNGGLRATHTAAAYMVMDKSSDPFVLDDTMYIPSCFISWTGEALDYKTPLLRSQEAISKEGTRLLQNLGFKDVNEVFANVGCEQEFFAIPQEMAAARPDILQAGRTVIGAGCPLGQEGGHYFSKIYPRVKAFFQDFQAKIWDLGISGVVYHNEVAPSQHEWSPIFSLVNVAADQNVLATEIAVEIGLKHGLAILHHEKPFAGINGSGKHCNWGLNSDTGMNLFTTGKSTEAEVSFVAFITALAHGVHKYGDALRASVATSGNDHRLGAQEAPPAIMSLYTGNKLGAHLAAAANGGDLSGYKARRYGDVEINTGARCTPTVGGGTEDRNRTAPLPFCGNRFEFRAVGSGQNISVPVMLLNTITAAGCAAISDLIESGKSVKEAVSTILKDAEPAIFNGNGYSAEWHKEAEEVRKLPNLKTAADAWVAFKSEKNKALFAKFGVLTDKEVDALATIQLEKYTQDLEVEAGCVIDMLNQGVIPAAATDLKTFDGANPLLTKLAGDRGETYGALVTEVANLKTVLQAVPQGNADAAAAYAKDIIKPAMAAARAAHDKAEKLIRKDLYPYPTYYDMLFPHQIENVQMA